MCAGRLLPRPIGDLCAIPASRPRTPGQATRILYRALLLAAAAFPAACAEGTAEPELRVASVRVDARSLLAAQGGPISVVERAELTVLDGAGRTSVLRAPLTAEASVATFEVRVHAGQQRFQGEVISNNGMVLYQGNREVEVQSDGFVVDIPLRALAAVLVASPDSARLPAGQTTATFTVANRGVQTLPWQVIAVDPPQSSCGQGACLVIRPDSGRVAPGQLSVVQVVPRSPGVRRLYRIRLGSPVGSVELQLLVDSAGPS